MATAGPLPEIMTFAPAMARMSACAQTAGPLTYAPHTAWKSIMAWPEAAAWK
jgi:hypothetical protein